MDLTKLFCENTVPVLYRQGEYGNDFSYDYNCWLKEFGPGSIGWLIQRSQDESAYPLPSTEENGISTIEITETESQYAGRAVFEVFFVNDGSTEKRVSRKLYFIVDSSLQNLGTVPQPWESYVDAVHADAVAAEEAREAIEAMSATAEMDNDDYGVPYVDVEKSMVDDHVNLGFSFGNLRGNGITGIALLSTIGLDKTYRISMDNGQFDFTVHDGDGIVSISKTGTSGLYDTYTILYESGNTSTFTVKNGNGITSAVLNPDYTLTLTFNEGSYTTPSIRGEKGETGNVYFATFDLNPTTGLLTMIYDDEYEGPSFLINSNGYLEVSINA
jgi:hypothetical protein